MYCLDNDLQMFTTKFCNDTVKYTLHMQGRSAELLKDIKLSGLSWKTSVQRQTEFFF